STTTTRSSPRSLSLTRCGGACRWRSSGFKPTTGPSSAPTHLQDVGILHRRIPRGCPESNGKVERSHRTDADEFYRRAQFKSTEELAKQLARWEHEYNHRRLHLALG